MICCGYDGTLWKNGHLVGATALRFSEKQPYGYFTQRRKDAKDFNGLVGALLFFAANMLAKHNQDNYTILTLIYSILLIGYLGAVTIMLCNFWFTQLPDMESNLPPRTLSRAVWVCIGCYYLLFPFWCVITAKLDQIVTG